MHFLQRRGVVRGGRLLAGIMALLLVAIVGGFAARPATTVAQDDEVALPSSITVVIGGLDTRTPEEPENTDVFMIARVDFDTQSVRVINVPRDLYLEIPGFGADKITRAYDFGSEAQDDDPEAGMALMKETIAHNFGLEIDAVVLTTFGGFEEIIDAVGGVDVVNPYDLYDGEYPTADYGYKEIFYPAGPLHLDGAQALEFSRTRHQDGDDGRVMRQQLVLRGLLEELRSPEIVAELPELLRTFHEAVRTDLTLDQVLSLTDAPEFSDDDVAFGSLLPYLYPSTAPDGAWIYAGDWSQLPGFVQGFLDGSISQ